MRQLAMLSLGSPCMVEGVFAVHPKVFRVATKEADGAMHERLTRVELAVQGFLVLCQTSNAILVS